MPCDLRKLFHILLLKDFLGPSLYTDVHLHSHVMGSKKMKLNCQWFHTAKNSEQVVTQKIWIQSEFSLSIMILDLHLIRQFRAFLMMKARTWIYVYFHGSKPFISLIWFDPPHIMRWLLVIGLFYSWENGDFEEFSGPFSLSSPEHWIPVCLILSFVFKICNFSYIFMYLDFFWSSKLCCEISGISYLFQPTFL